MALGRYIKVNMTSNWGGSLVGMATLHACDSAGVKWNNETMPHTYGVQLNGNASDCSNTNTGDYWQFYASALPNWWKVDLGAVRSIAKFKTQAFTGDVTRGMNDFTVQVSDDDVSWTTILTAQTLYNTLEQQFDIPSIVAIPTVALTLATPHPFFLPVIPDTAQLTLTLQSVQCGAFMYPPIAAISSAVSAPMMLASLPIPATPMALTVNPVQCGACTYPPIAMMSFGAMSPELSILLLAPAIDLQLAAHQVQAGNFRYPPVCELTFGLQPPSVLLAYLPDTLELLLSANNPTYEWNVNDSDLSSLQIIYKCYITGDAETPAIEDLELPMSSFQSTLRNGEPSYISCVIPNATAYANDIVARSHGDIVVKYGYRFKNGQEQMVEIARVDYEDIRIDTGAKNSSVTISGHATIVASNAVFRAASGVSYYSLQANGLRRIRASVDMWLRCGDIVTYQLNGLGQQFAVGEISYTVSPRAATMEVVEA